MGHLQWSQAFDAHLFGPFLFAILTACVLLSLIPQNHRRLVAGPQARMLWSAVEPALLASWLVWAVLRLVGLGA